MKPLKTETVIKLMIVVMVFISFQLVRYEPPMIIKTYRYENHKLVSSQVYQNDEVKCK